MEVERDGRQEIFADWARAVITAAFLVLVLTSSRLPGPNDPPPAVSCQSGMD
jgi:hypothetical protein